MPPPLNDGGILRINVPNNRTAKGTSGVSCSSAAIMVPICDIHSVHIDVCRLIRFICSDLAMFVLNIEKGEV